MLSLTKVPTHFFVSPKNFSELNRLLNHSFIPFNIFEGNSRNKKQKLMSLRFVDVKESGSLFLELKKDFCWSNCSGFVRKCKKDWEAESDFALEAEILEFMKDSEKPEAFPCKKDLVDAGRMDLVEAILKQGGWLTSGWDLNDDNANEEDEVFCTDDLPSDLKRDKGFKNEVSQEMVLGNNQERSHEVSSYNGGSYAPAASWSGRSLETEAEDDSGIEGILSRLEKERNMNFGFGLSETGGSTHVQVKDFAHGLLAKSSRNMTLAGLERNSTPASSSPDNDKLSDPEDKLGNSRSQSHIDGFRHSLKPDAWRMWSTKRAGLSEMEFEADEFICHGTRTGGEMDALGDEILQKSEGATASSNGRKGNCCSERVKFNDIRSRLQQLESELSSVLSTLKSNSGKNASQRVGSSDDLAKLSDAWEFQETEIMKAQDRLRSIRAKLAVLEGKMALAIIESQKIVEEKQKRVDDAQRALQLLRTACIVWTSSASEVLLAGSFDGWNTKRKMQKSSGGIFSVCMKLYPGKYEIKFIVDGEWKVDPLRPIVRNDRYENNVLIIT
ncbi:protein PTST homolog 2, chloroplastic isoform X2 [Ricinus communis]|uniref:protein PTST homolog 2, chloroplastic isoform X2 n=1 Tax=Ricinus communis TaxID=3988 RepID=UPI00201A5039|nr:protein PTST homolog 2, chloroplastic isoform X2 [Ricinus communis]